MTRTFSVNLSMSVNSLAPGAILIFQGDTQWNWISIFDLQYRKNYGVKVVINPFLFCHAVFDVVDICICERTCRCANAGRWSDWHGGGTVSQSESPAHWRLQRQLGSGGRRQNCRWTGQTRQRSFYAWSYRGVCLCDAEIIYCLCVASFQQSVIELFKHERTQAGRTKRFLTLTIMNRKECPLKATQEENS